MIHQQKKRGTATRFLALSLNPYLKKSNYYGKNYHEIVMATSLLNANISYSFLFGRKGILTDFLVDKYSISLTKQFKNKINLSLVMLKANEIFLKAVEILKTRTLSHKAAFKQQQIYICLSRISKIISHLLFQFSLRVYHVVYLLLLCIRKLYQFLVK